MSSRWLGYYTSEASPDRASRRNQDHEEQQYRDLDLAAQYAAQLRDIQSRCANDANFARPGLSGILSNASLEGFLERAPALTPSSHQGSYHSAGDRSVRNIQQSGVVSQEVPPQGHPRTASIASDLDRRYHSVQLHDTHSAQRPPTRPRPPVGLRAEKGKVPPEEASPRTVPYGSVRSPVGIPSGPTMMGTNSSWRSHADDYGPPPHPGAI